MNKFEKEILKKLDVIMLYIQVHKASAKIEEEEVKNVPLDIDVKKLELEDHNFKINSDGWKKITVDKKSYLVNPENDIWEINRGKYKGEQLFTWDAAMRETTKRNKRIPNDEELKKLLKTKDDIKNLKLAGYRYTDGSFNVRTTYSYVWSSSQSGSSAWARSLNSGAATVGRYASSKACGFSVRCLKNN